MNNKSISINQPAFGKMFTGNNAKRVISNCQCPKSIINQFIYAKKLLRKQGINKLENIDMFLDYSNYNRAFLLEIKPRNNKYYSGTQSHKFNKIANREDCLKNLREWAEYWDEKYAL